MFTVKERGDTPMTNRRFEMHEIRQALVRMRMSESNRTIAKTGLIGRNKAGVQGTTIHQTLVNRFGFKGSYSSNVRLPRPVIMTLRYSVLMPIVPLREFRGLSDSRRPGSISSMPYPMYRQSLRPGSR
ncbi:MAG: hypothetical protein GY820_46890 [Gammaproteobacteria bacterium]|nr:hypothetical protein [Gammaproteobacteria bacterium]